MCRGCDAPEPLSVCFGPREQHVLRERFGLAGTGAPPRSPREIARDFETTAAYVRTIEHRAIRKLRSEGEKGSLDALHSYVERLDAVENSAEGLS